MPTYFARRIDHEGRPGSPEQYLVAAVIAQAIADARAGDRRAAHWLAAEAPAIVEKWLDLDPGVLARWSEVSPAPEAGGSAWDVEWGLRQVT